MFSAIASHTVILTSRSKFRPQDLCRSIYEKLRNFFKSLFTHYRAKFEFFLYDLQRLANSMLLSFKYLFSTPIAWRRTSQEHYFVEFFCWFLKLEQKQKQNQKVKRNIWNDKRSLKQHTYRLYMRKSKKLREPHDKHADRKQMLSTIQ